jgi:hypothetical protein
MTGARCTRRTVLAPDNRQNGWSSQGRVAWFTLESLTAAVGRAGADGSVARTITKITRADLIVVDLCRHRDYAEGAGVSGRGPVDGDGLVSRWPLGLSA